MSNLKLDKHTRDEPSDLQDRIALFMLKYLLPLPIVRRSFKLRMFNETEMMEVQKRLPPDVSEVVFIGSQYDGLSVTVTSLEGGDAFFAMSDYDDLVVLKKYVVKDQDVPGDKLKSEPLTSTETGTEILDIHEASHPGYCRLLSRSRNKFVGMRFNEDCSGKVDIYFDGVEAGSTFIPYREMFPGIFGEPDTEEVKVFVHGPAISCTTIEDHPGEIPKTGLETDIVLALKCQAWPQAASEWFQRKRWNTWPSPELQETVKETGCYVVGVAHALSPKPEEEWRYSFAPVEKVLARSFSYTQRGSYILAKMLFKSVVKETDKVSSYCLKTKMFWLLESETTVWKYENIGAYALRLLRALAEGLKAGVISNYIIPANNIISHIPRENLLTVSEKLNALVQNPLPVMEEIRKTTKYFGAIIHPPEDTFRPITSLLQIVSPDAYEVDSRFQDTKLAVIKHYCSTIRKPVMNGIQKQFRQMKYAILIDIVEGESRSEIENTEQTDEVKVISDELSEYCEENAHDWCTFVEDYHRNIDKIQTYNVAQILSFFASQAQGYHLIEFY